MPEITDDPMSAATGCFVTGPLLGLASWVLIAGLGMLCIRCLG